MATEKKYSDEKRIVLFKNEFYEDGTDLPLYRGMTWINNQKYHISMWCRKDKNGKFYYQGQLQTEEEYQKQISKNQPMEEIDQFGDRNQPMEKIDDSVEK